MLMKTLIITINSLITISVESILTIPRFQEGVGILVNCKSRTPAYIDYILRRRKQTFYVNVTL